ncbi:MAG: lysophospholipid acyltransferase family protein [Myxococcota bacterium]|nr:lysophospholipid acyltransferase family protein [Myxococcota bacterium]
MLTGDLRCGVAWSPLQRVKNDALWWLASIALAATRPLPIPVLRYLGRCLGAVAHALVPRARRIAIDNVGRVFPGLDAVERSALVRRCYATLGELLGETIAPLASHRFIPPLPVCARSLGLIDQARAEGRGVVFASAHLGPWESVAASLVAAGVPLVTLVRESYDPRFSRLYERLRTRHGVRVVWRASPGAAVQIVRTLRAGGVLGMPMDLCARVASCDAPFLGHDAPTAIGAARLAIRMGAVVVVGTAAPFGDGLQVTVTRIGTNDLPRQVAGEHELTRRINEELSRRILDLPHAWVWMHERWPSQTRV